LLKRSIPNDDYILSATVLIWFIPFTNELVFPTPMRVPPSYVELSASSWAIDKHSAEASLLQVTAICRKQLAQARAIFSPEAMVDE
jgi:hypothetical protein